MDYFLFMSIEKIFVVISRDVCYVVVDSYLWDIWMWFKVIIERNILFYFIDGI